MSRFIEYTQYIFRAEKYSRWMYEQLILCVAAANDKKSVGRDLSERQLYKFASNFQQNNPSHPNH